jgi:membrane protein required for colicin V production
MNSFDIVVLLGLVIAVVTGFNTGLLRSVVTILAYLFAMPLALWVMSTIAPQLGSQFEQPLAQNWGFCVGVFLAAGMGLGKLARIALDETIGSELGIVDRLSGAALGALRVGLIATSVVLVFDQLIPAGREPAFLKGSQLRPLFSAAGQKGFRSLPPELAATIDRLKQQRRI